jgi:hypothetical protein
VLDKKGRPQEAELEIRYRRIRVLPPIGKKSRYPELQLTVIYAQERETPSGRDPIDDHHLGIMVIMRDMLIIISRSWS